MYSIRLQLLVLNNDFKIRWTAWQAKRTVWRIALFYNVYSEINHLFEMYGSASRDRSNYCDRQGFGQVINLTNAVPFRILTVTFEHLFGIRFWIGFSRVSAIDAQSLSWGCWEYCSTKNSSPSSEEFHVKGSEVKVISDAMLKSKRFKEYFIEIWTWGAIRVIIRKVLSEEFQI